MLIVPPTDPLVRLRRAFSLWHEFGECSHVDIPIGHEPNQVEPGSPLAWHRKRYIIVPSFLSCSTGKGSFETRLFKIPQFA